VLFVALLCLAAAALSPLADPTGFGPPVARAAASTGPVDRAVAALQAAQRRDGGFGAAPGAGRSDPATTVWAALALAAVGVHPADQPGRGTTVLSYLGRRGAGLTDTGDLARLVLVLRAAGSGGDLAAASTAALVGRQRADGGWADADGGPARVAASSFAILALSTAADDASRAAVQRGGAWLRAAHDGSGWGTAPGGRARADTTGLALQALRAAQPDEFELTSAAQSFLNARGRADGGLAGARPSRSDAVATAFAMQGLRATGIDPATFRGLDGTTAGAYLEDRQRSDGGFGSTLRTAQVLPGLNGVALPLRTVARGSDRASAAAPGAERENGAAGAATTGGADALTGAQTGGGDAPAAGDGGSSSPGAGSAPGGSASAGSSSPSAGSSSPSAGAGASSAGAATGDGADAKDPAGGGASSPGPATPAADGGSAAGRPVDGVVVGATRASATAPGGVAAAGGGGSTTSPALVLGGAMVLLALVGSGLERRRPRRVLS
jgi:hypothetical protein